MEHAYAAIGRAVFAAQRLETVLVPIFEFFRMKTEPGYLEKTQGYISAGVFKVPVRRIVTTLSAKGDITPDLEELLSKYIEDRNTLIHRWILKHGWPDDTDANGFVPTGREAGQ